MFEALYHKPTSSTQSEYTASCKQSSPTRHPDFDGNTFRKPKKRMDKWRQQEVHDDEDKKVLVGSNYLVDREKWNENQFIKFDTQQRRKQINKSFGPEDEEDVKYKTFSKRTFRPNFVDPTDIRSLVWFVDTAEQAGGDEKPKKEYSGPPVRFFNRKPVARADTFRVNRNPETSTHSLNEPIRVEIKPDSGAKLVPIGVAAPYNSHRTVSHSKRSPSILLQQSSLSTTYEPTKILINRSNNSSGVRDRRSPPPPYTSQNMQKPPQRTFSSSTVIIGASNRDSEESIGRREQDSGYDDVLNAVRAPNSLRSYKGSALRSRNPIGLTAHPQAILVDSKSKVKSRRPVWR